MDQPLIHEYGTCFRVKCVRPSVKCTRMRVYKPMNILHYSLLIRQQRFNLTPHFWKMKAFSLLLFASCLLCTALSYMHHAPVEVDKDDGLRLRLSSTKDEAEQDNQEMKEENTLPRGMESNPITILGHVNAPFPADDVPSTPSTWKLVGKLDMSDPFQKCPASLSKISSPRASCGKSTGASCNGFTVPTSEASYQTVCGRFRGYQIATTDAFWQYSNLGNTIDDPYVDGISITYRAHGERRHIFTYASGAAEYVSAGYTCPCNGGAAPPAYVGSDYYCESGNAAGYDRRLFHEDPLWDGQQCGGLEGTCCNPPNLGWFCKTFPTTISGDIEVRLCVDQDLQDENIALEFFELYIK